ncbi:hypothetical protein PR202_ga19883 [Eleusine coracana subsp. coracana]|uniref:YqaJ viral recombinase domain-containing protein n=1 Tax=Eleusine coracana subsp. coracana TaxID=191504 RepID=A0AAV5CVQ3_ELECO|nr:hypothetical protein PR202_ga19883 [Eleusine coracana subsp. coracana]
MRAAVSSPSPHCLPRRRVTLPDARHVFDHVPQRPVPPLAAGIRAQPLAASTAARRPARRSAVSAAPTCSAASVARSDCFACSSVAFEPLGTPANPESLFFIVSSLMVSSQLSSSDVAQRSEEWFALRKDKLTTSTFSTALGFWSGNRRAELWNEKVFGPMEIKLADAARSAMDWGTNHESIAIEQYTSITGRMGVSLMVGSLEVKCPFNKGKPELALPWRVMPYYYMPQVQGLMEIMDRDWVELYCWTPNGSSLIRVPRDRAYWELIHDVLREFWWGNVIPARELVLLGKEAEARSFEPQPKHRLTNLVLFRSRKLASEAKLLCMDVGGHVEFFQ